MTKYITGLGGEGGVAVYRDDTNALFGLEFPASCTSCYLEPGEVRTLGTIIADHLGWNTPVGMNRILSLLEEKIKTCEGNIVSLRGQFNRAYQMGRPHDGYERELVRWQGKRNTYLALYQEIVSMPLVDKKEDRND